MFQTCFMFTRFALWPRLLYLFHHMLASNNYLVFSGSEEKEVQIIIHNPTWNITWKWGALVRAEAEGEFQGLVLRSNQEQSFFFKKETWEPDNGKKLSLSLVWAKNLMKERFCLRQKEAKICFQIKNLVPRRLPNPSGPDLHEVSQVDQKGVRMVREERNRGPRSVQLGLQPVRPVAPQEGEAVVVGVLRVENLGTWIPVGLVPCKSQLTCGRWFERLFFYLVAFLPPDVLPFSIQ